MGASQGIGLETVKAALAAGHRVRAFARSAARIDPLGPEPRTVHGRCAESHRRRVGA
ncbi:hypothetical protein MKK58_00725 [Methylobacterium sp. J-078]|uniref:hypothetical protein n=1 Tax=Methylobacterium sp. J-078 TaxID=2836657 RepID=UPI001FB9BC28|nr:hypothetical protein [Methylobacterium sp. J-078]MCJ2043079.1 hypothetical protein [Methylobacterium sp. J-078]